jgi:hypothetical protein
MPGRKLAAKAKDKLSGGGVILPVKRSKSQSKISASKSYKSELSFIQSNDEYGEGFPATLMDGLSVDIFKIAGLEWTAELHDAIWRNHNWKSLLKECDAAEIIETSSQDPAPGMSDVFFWIAITEPKKFRQELRAVMLATARE